MEHRFIKFEEAVDKLGISAERLNQLREDGELRAYRDGASWKFRADEIDRLVEEGVPDRAPPSDIGLIDDAELVDASDLAGLPDLGDDELGLAGDDELSLESDLKLSPRDQGGSELDLAALDDETVTAGTSDPGLKDADDPSDPSDSILLSEEALGESSAPPSTIIGKSELESKDADLELVTDADDDSDVKLSSGGASEVLSSHVAGSGVLDDVEKDSGNTSAFEGLEELELDLAAESGRILGGQEADDFAAEVGVGGKVKPKGDSDLTLKDVELAGEDEGTDPIPAALDKGTPKAKKDSGPTSDLELVTDDDDDFVLAEAGGSDITLDSADSGINLIDPSDSGLALDDIPLEMGGSAILESLSLGGDKSDADISLVGDAPVAPTKPRAKLQTDDDFRLTPLGDREEDGDSSSQVIALDAGMEDLGAGDAGILGEDVFAEEPEGVQLVEDYEGEPGGEFGTAYSGAAARSESEYSLMNILGLGACMMMLLLGVIVMMDMVRNIWSWDQNLALNDSLLNSLLGLFGLS